MIEQTFREWGLGDAANWLSELAMLTTLVVVALAAHFVARRVLRPALLALVRKTRTRWDDVLVEHKVLLRLIHVVPALVLFLGASGVYGAGDPLRGVLQRLSLGYMILTVGLVLTSFLSAVVVIYDTSFPGAKERPILSYVQVVKIFIGIFTTILILATVMNRSPWGLVGGLGALTAVLLLVFKDSILGLVASIQLASNDMVRVGDWIEMPNYGADGNVVEISLTAVKVRNWDKTVSTIPTYRLISDAFKNWRGMTESGGRRIKRVVYIDISSICFLDSAMFERFRKIQLIQSYLQRKVAEIRDWNRDQEVDEDSLVNGRNLTNVGTFRAYVEAYLRNHPQIHQDMTFLIRHLEPTEHGLPMQIYVFSHEQRWEEYEALQADIFDHILAAASEFDLRVFQSPTGADMRALASEMGRR
ncbi:MAG: mechanosensitive ion channel family protein [Deltaproteobacteria bacterium]|nr:mechanosensitive ion channel family protein [Deltaproteobacteria bacterium]